MQYPLVILAGKAGSGKDTVASILQKEFNGVVIAQADPLKRFAMQLFGFTEEQLWGPSEMRNKPVSLDPKLFGYDWHDLHRNFHILSKGMTVSNWLNELGFKFGHSQRGYVYGKLNDWLGMVADHDSLARETTPRYILQTLGTEFGRSIKPTIWADHARDLAVKILSEGGTYDKIKGHIPGPERPAVAIISDGRFRNEILSVKALGGAPILVVNPEERAASFSAHVSEQDQDSIPDWWFSCKIINDKRADLDKLHRVVLEVGNYLGMWRPTSFGHGGR